LFVRPHPQPLSLKRRGVMLPEVLCIVLLTYYPLSFFKERGLRGEVKLK
jgi:hypothetical protein